MTKNYRNRKVSLQFQILVQKIAIWNFLACHNTTLQNEQNLPSDILRAQRNPQNNFVVPYKDSN